jgi:hypothetical protein
MRIQTGQLVALGYGKYVRSDEVVAVEPITDGRGPGRRTLVWVRGVPDPLVASRADASIIDDLVTPAEEAARMRELRGTLERVTGALEGIPSVLRRVIDQETGVDVHEVAADGRRTLEA